MLARRVLPVVAQLRFKHAAIVATLCANISLAGMYSEIRNIEHGYMLSFLLQMLFDSKRELCTLWDIPGMLLVPSARSEQQDVILCFEIFDEPSAFCRDEAYVFLFRAGHEIHAFLLKPGIFLWDAFKTIDRPTVAAEQGAHNHLRRKTGHILGLQKTLLVSAAYFSEFRAIREPRFKPRTH